MSKTDTVIKERDSNFELLRIFAMILIVWNHLCLHGIIIPSNKPLDFNIIISKCFFIWTGNLGNYLFIFLSGYFVPTTQFSWKKVFKIWQQVFSISIIIGLLYYFLKIPLLSANIQELGFYDSEEKINFLEIPFTIKNLVHCFFPIILGNNWVI